MADRIHRRLKAFLNVARVRAKRRPGLHGRFLRPVCGELRATVNPRNNLTPCSCCGHRTNNIDLLMSLDYDFLSAVELLAEWLRQHRERQVNSKT